MILEPTSHFAEPYEIDDVDEHSAASDSGVRDGDILVAINGRAAAEFSLDQIRTMFMQDRREYSLTVKREGKPLPIRLKWLCPKNRISESAF